MASPESNHLAGREEVGSAALSIGSEDLLPSHAAWRKYVVDDGAMDIHVVRPEVANSWQRCRNLKVNPHLDATDKVNHLELRERLFKNQLLVKVAYPSMENLYNFVKGSGFQVVLTDETGFLLEVLGDDSIVTRTRPVHLCPGGNWNETSKGTNAIGKSPVGLDSTSRPNVMPSSIARSRRGRRTIQTCNPSAIIDPAAMNAS